MAEKAKRPTKRSERVWKNREATGGSVNISARHLQMAKDVANFCIHPSAEARAFLMYNPVPYSGAGYIRQRGQGAAVASRNSLPQILATQDASGTPAGTYKPAQPRPDGLTPYPGGGACYTVYFREFFFHALR